MITKQNTTKICDYQISERFVKANHPNTAWSGPNLETMERNFVAAFVDRATVACESCQRGHCCGSCWCCYDARRAVAPVTQTIMDLLHVCGDVGCNWISPNGQDRETNLTEVCGGSGYFGRALSGCPRCGSGNIGTTDNGTYICYNCGKVWR
jgi:hypothetical protein